MMPQDTAGSDFDAICRNNGHRCPKNDQNKAAKEVSKAGERVVDGGGFEIRIIEGHTTDWYVSTPLQAL